MAWGSIHLLEIFHVELPEVRHRTVVHWMCPSHPQRARGSSAPAASSPSQIWEIGDIVEGHPGRLAPPPLNISRQRLQAREPADQLRHGRRGGID
ncbi:hypothetical protein PG999_009804 [Apiospora kogelbergensis]|uniref:Uncharacterized protein n=1 Tax=Apiospora kogelbergensis TaxID=1337665 RepID=A0AAW0QKJ6_9PEZI